jgi:hypothetical protein
MLDESRKKISFMRKFITSAGLIALSAAGTQAAVSAGNPSGDKFWDVSLTVRGFYDDNYNTTDPKTTTNGVRSTFGIETKPSIGIHFAGEQTSFGAHYEYDMRYYTDADRNNQNDADHSHEFNVWLMHQFSERYSVDAADTFTLAQQPQFLDPSATSATTTRINGNNVHNDATADVHAQLTRLVELVLGYNNNYYNYEQPYYAGLLNRMEQDVSARLRWQLQPETTVSIGYAYGWGNYFGGQVIGTYTPATTLVLTPIYSHARDYRRNTIFAGLDHNFNRSLSGHIEAGADINSNYNNPAGSKTYVNPYVDANLRYTYASGCFAVLGFKQIHNATDQFSVDSNGNITSDTESSIVYLDITHAITSKLIAKLDAQYQYAAYEGGTLSSSSSSIYSVGLDLSYKFTQHLSADLGYNYDRTDASNSSGYSYDRNQVFLGMTASY